LARLTLVECCRGSCALDESIVNYVKRLSGLTDITSSEFDVTAQLEDGAIIVIEVKAADSNERPALEATAALVIEGVNWRREFGDRVMVATLTPDLAAQVTQFAKLAADDKRMTERLVNAMFTRNTVSPAAAQQARRNAEARQELIDEFGLFDSDQLAEMAGSKAKNRSATASRWLAERRVFAVEHLGHRYFPAFQFGIDSRPRPVVRRILEVFEPHGLEGWELALWFTTASGWLDDQRPVDRLAGAPDDVVMSAERTFGEEAA
jgi:hypothetical protein